MGRHGAERGRLFGGGMGSEFDTIGGMGGERVTRIECAKCGTAMGVVTGHVYGPAYCGECWERIQEDGAGAVAVGDARGGEDAVMDEDGGGAGGAGGTEHGGDAAEVGAPGEGGGRGEEGGSGGLALRLRAIMHSLRDERGGESPTRKEVLEMMAIDGGGGAWRTADEAAYSLDNALCGIVYEPADGRLSLIDGE